MVVLGLAPDPLTVDRRLGALAQQLFRPRWLARLPNAPQCRSQLLALSATIPVIGLPAAEMRDPVTFRTQGEKTLELVRSFLF